MLWLAAMSIVPDNYLYGIARLAIRRGRATEIGKAIGLTKARVGQWTMVPDKHLAEVSRISGIPTWALRPDLAATLGGHSDLENMLLPWQEDVAEFLATLPAHQQQAAAAA